MNKARKMQNMFKVEVWCTQHSTDSSCTCGLKLVQSAVVASLVGLNEGTPRHR